MISLKHFLLNIKNSYVIGKRILSDPYFNTTSAITKTEINKSPRRSVIINHLLALTPGTNYLEIGVRNPEKNFNRINCLNKYSVDPGVEFETNPVDYKMTSDTFFQALRGGKINLIPSIKFDVIFIDGLHLANQVERDILNSLHFISDRGFIILHDCNPPSEFHARESYNFSNSPAGSFWNGTTWKAFYKFRYHQDLYSICFDTDWGVGVISKFMYPEFNNLKVPINNPYFEFISHLNNRKLNMNLQNFDTWIKNVK